MKWIDTYDIATELADKYPSIDPTYILFTDLYSYVCSLERFSDIPENSNEKILEAIQQAWIQERD